MSRHKLSMRWNIAVALQENLANLPIAVIDMVAASNRLESLEPLVPADSKP